MRNRLAVHLALAAGLLLLAGCGAGQEDGPGTSATAGESAGQPTAAASVSPAATDAAPASGTPAPTASPAVTAAGTAAPEAPQEGQPPTALEAAKTVMRALSRGDMETVAAWTHAERGVRFSPYAYVDVERDIVLTREELSGAMDDSTKRIWREFAGSGELIDLAFADYYKQFVYDADFFGAAEIALNQGLGQGTTVNNINEVYPAETHDFVEYHIDGIDPAVEGMDWRSLRLVFEKIGEDRALVGIVHDQWTP
ncbi:hypothetical protein [Paenibacillus tengchongensis]|uniref:hypothetical protein n=1 Tax=Paenibacillus tengchongensis TaxID=2608684 RepID=UPI00124F555D|nr:hypothetical protein [Paenibacillus tengchongensis]